MKQTLNESSMETILIIIHLMIVVALVIVVLLQRSEGGALGIGGGGGLMSARGAANALTRTTAILAAAFFVLGLSTVFVFLGFTASIFGQFFLQNQDLLAKIAGAVVIVFGLHFLGVFRISILDRDARMDAGDRGGSARF